MGLLTKDYRVVTITIVVIIVIFNICYLIGQIPLAWAFLGNVILGLVLKIWQRWKVVLSIL